MSKIKIAFVGTGGRCNAHLDGLLRRRDEFGDVEFAGFMDIVPERAKEKCEKAKEGKVYTDYIEMLDSAKPDALVIAVFPNQHGMIENEAIKRNIHLLMEKPMAIEKSMAEDFGEKINRAGIVTSCGFQDRYLNLTEKIRELVVGRKVGFVNGAWIGGVVGGLEAEHWWKKYSTGGGQLLEQNIHVFDQIRFLFGEAKTVFCTGGRGIVNAKNYDVHDYSAAAIQMENGISATVYTSCYPVHGFAEGSGITVYAENAKIDYKLRSHIDYSDSTGTTMHIPHASKRDWTTELDYGFIKAVKTGDKSDIKSDYFDALKSLKLCMACTESLFTGKSIDIAGY